MTARLKEVQSWMEFFGWENGGRPGSVKRSQTGRNLGAHGGEVWDRDVEEAIEKIERMAKIKST